MKYLSLLVLAAVLSLIGTLSWAWSFDSISLGGYLGFSIPLVGCLLAYFAGFAHGHGDGVDTANSCIEEETKRVRALTDGLKGMGG